MKIWTVSEFIKAFIKLYKNQSNTDLVGICNRHYVHTEVEHYNNAYHTVLYIDECAYYFDDTNENIITEFLRNILSQA